MALSNTQQNPQNIGESENEESKGCRGEGKAGSQTSADPPASGTTHPPIHPLWYNSRASELRTVSEAAPVVIGRVLVPAWPREWWSRPRLPWPTQPVACVRLPLLPTPKRRPHEGHATVRRSAVSGSPRPT